MAEFGTELTGFKLGEARETLAQQGFEIENIKVLAQPRLKDLTYDDTFKVVFVKKLNEKSVRLYICKPFA